MSLIRKPKRRDTFLGPVGVSMSMVLLNEHFFQVDWLTYCIPALTILIYHAFDWYIFQRHKDRLRNEQVNATRLLYKELEAIKVDMNDESTTHERQMRLSEIHDKTTRAIQTVTKRRFNHIDEIHSIVDKVRSMREE